MTSIFFLNVGFSKTSKQLNFYCNARNCLAGKGSCADQCNWGFVCLCVLVCAHSHEVPSFIYVCVHAGISLVSSLAGLVSAGLSIGQIDL